MRHDNGGDPEHLIEFANQLGDHAHGNRIESGERLVVHDHHRFEHDGARQRNAPRHAAGQLRGHQVARAAQTHGLEFHQHHVSQHRLGQPGVLADGEGNILEHGQIGEQRAVLEQHTHALAQLVQLLMFRSGTFSPSTRTWPWLGRKCPPIRFNSEVFPQPLPPMMAVILPRAMRKFSCCRMVRVSRLNVRSRISTQRVAVVSLVLGLIQSTGFRLNGPGAVTTGLGGSILLGWAGDCQ